MVGPRRTLTPLAGTRAKTWVLLGSPPIASLEIQPNLRGSDVESRRELDVPDVITAELDVHEAGHALRGRSIAVVADALNERRGTVTHPDDADPNLAQDGDPSEMRPVNVC